MCSGANAKVKEYSLYSSLLAHPTGAYLDFLFSYND